MPDASDSYEQESHEKMPLLDHLVELRKRLLWCVVALIAVFSVCMYFAADIFNFLAAPLFEAFEAMDLKDRKLIYTQLY